jgi:hypothetical protein
MENMSCLRIRYVGCVVRNIPYQRIIFILHEVDNAVSRIRGSLIASFVG